MFVFELVLEEEMSLDAFVEMPLVPFSSESSSSIENRVPKYASELVAFLEMTLVAFGSL